MLWRLVRASLWRRWRRKAVMVGMVTLGTAVLVSLLQIVLHVQDRMAEEFRGYGPNLHLVAAPGPLAETTLPEIKRVFWRNNIVHFTPVLLLFVECRGQAVPLIGTWFQHRMPLGDDPEFTTGAVPLHPFWTITGRVPGETAGAELLMGATLAGRLGVGVGDPVELWYQGAPVPARVVGLVRTGEDEDEQVFAPLAWTQTLQDRPGQVDQVFLSVLARPEDRLSRTPIETMTGAEYEQWYCAPYLSSIAHQLEEALPGSRVRPLSRVAAHQGNYLRRLRLLLGFLAGTALVLTVVGIKSTVSAVILERQAEIGLMQALGSAPSGILGLLVLEMTAVGLLGAGLGTALGSLLADRMSWWVFGQALPWNPLLIPLAALLARG